MIITKTPFRISFFGGGTDYPIWYQKHGGTVLSATINKYCYISCRYLPPFFDHKYRIRYTHREEVSKISEIHHPSVRECLKFLNIHKGIEMVHTSDLPAMSGIGSSSAFTVGFLNALNNLIGANITKKQLALDAIDIEQNIIKENVGSQDQVAASYGGLNKIIFKTNNDIQVKSVNLNPSKLNLFQKHLLLFFTRFSRRASTIASEQIKNTPLKEKELIKMQTMVDEGMKILNGKPENYYNFGKLLHKSWKLKRSLTNLISNSEIDHIYETALQAGALGGKLCGAGGGGFMLLFVPPKKQDQVKEKLKKLLYVPFRFENLGSQIIFHENQDFF